MIAELKIECLGGCYFETECVKVIEFDLEDSLYDLHSFILDSVDFDCDHLSMFFVGKNPKPHSQSNIATYQEEIEECEDYDDEDIDAANYDTTLAEIFPLPPKYKLYYLFDFGDGWIFSIKKSRKKTHDPVAAIAYPRIIKEIGTNPEQYPSCEEW